MIAFLIGVILLAPAATVLICLLVRRARLAERINLAASMLVLLAALPLPWLVAGGARHFLDNYLIADGLGTWAVLCAAVVYFLASLYAVGYMRLLDDAPRLPNFYALFAGFALTILLAPLMNNVGVYWIAIEFTTLVSTFLVGFERAPESVEAAWKYIVVVSAGISLALLATVLLYWDGSLVLGPRYDMTWDTLTGVAPKLNGTLLDVGVLLAMIGYGTKVGLAPMHTWLPDAHSEAPAPVSALLSGALLNTALVGIVRLLAVADRAHAARVPHIVLVVLGLLSLLIGGLFIIRQRGVKRLMAYSSVEHMGVMALGFGIGGPLGVAGALYHMLNHALNKSLMFFGAGYAMRAYGSKQIGAIHRFGEHFPVTGALWLAGAVAITGAPPFGLFLSELTVLRAGLGGGYAWAAALMLVLLIVIFIGFLNQFRAMYYSDNGLERAPVTAATHAWCVAPMWLALLPLLLLGLWWPQGFSRLFAAISAALSGGGA